MEKKKRSSCPNTTPTFYLKVNLQCCKACRRTVRKKLQKLDGVFAVDVDSEKGLVSVTGTVDPQFVVRKIRKWGKKRALLCSPPPKSGKSPKMDAESYSDEHDSDFHSDSDDHDENCEVRGKRSRRKHPELQEKPAAAPPQKVKKPCWFWRMFGKDKGGTKPQGVPSLGPRPRFANPGPGGFGQRRPMMMPPQYGAPWPNYPPPQWGRPLPPYGMPQLPPYGMPQYPPPPPLPGGVFQSRQHPSQRNPITHYTRYEDNYINL